MKIVLMGNAGAGKTTLSRALMGDVHVPRLSLDEVAFSKGAERRPLTESIRDVLEFIGANENWIVEGCYADIIEPALEHCETLVFLNPGVATCIEHCRRRPWEPEKFASESEQEQNLDNLIKWVSEYETRRDEYGLEQHRRLFDSFSGRKFEFTSVVPDAAQQVVAADI
ncbi:MAG: shikimate kinase [Elainellaceae cyanobacterium]